MADSDVTVEISKGIREELRGFRAEVKEGLHESIAECEPRVSCLEARVDKLESN
jgi:hypothetical protein